MTKQKRKSKIEKLSDWRSDLRRRAQELEARLMAMPEPTPEEIIRNDELTKKMFQGAAIARKNGWTQGG